MLRNNKVLMDMMYEYRCSVHVVTIAFACDTINVWSFESQDSATEQKVVVVSVSPQSRASLAAHYDLSSSEAGKRLTSFFKSLGECNFFYK